MVEGRNKPIFFKDWWGVLRNAKRRPANLSHLFPRRGPTQPLQENEEKNSLLIKKKVRENKRKLMEERERLV